MTRWPLLALLVLGCTFETHEHYPAPEGGGGEPPTGGAPGGDTGGAPGGGWTQSGTGGTSSGGVMSTGGADASGGASGGSVASGGVTGSGGEASGGGTGGTGGSVDPEPEPEPEPVQFPLPARYTAKDSCWMDEFPNPACKELPATDPPAVEWMCGPEGSEEVARLRIPVGSCLRLAGQFRTSLSDSCQSPSGENSTCATLTNVTDGDMFTHVHRRRGSAQMWTAWWYEGACEVLCSSD